MKRIQRTAHIMQNVHQSEHQEKSTIADATTNINNMLMSVLHADYGRSLKNYNNKMTSEVEMNKKVESTGMSSSYLPVAAELPADVILSKTFETEKIDENIIENIASISPPPYSPLTPLLLNNLHNKTGEPSVPSPLPLMSPETQKLFDTLCEPILNKGFLDESTFEHVLSDQQTIFNTSNDDCSYVENSDDSIKDPDYVVDTTKKRYFVEESDSLESDADDDFSSSNSKSVKQTQTVSTNKKHDAESFDNIAPLTRDSSLRSFSTRFPMKPIVRRLSESCLWGQPPIKFCRRLSAPSLVDLQKQSNDGDLQTLEPEKRLKSDPSKWKRRVERDKRLKGEAYKTVKGKLVPARPIKHPSCATLPKHKCNNEVPEQVRKNIYNSFRSLNTLEEQRLFIIQHVTETSKKRQTISGPSRKNYTKNYFLTVGHNNKVKVCREFFLQTLSITEGMVRGALKKVSAAGTLLPDGRGRKAPANKLNSDDEEFLRSHILSFPAMESHYCRKNSQYRYLDSKLNISIMYTLYKEKCQQECKSPVGCEKYRQIFRSYKLKFHVPKKDLCKKCVVYSELSKHNEQTVVHKELQQKHLKRRDDAYLRRNYDKEAAKSDNKVLSFNFDLQAVLQTPKGAAGPYFYVRKLAVYNLTLYNLGNQNVDCYTWDETQGKRGSVEIGTSVYKYINSHSDITHVRMMSDNCGGQQKNFNFSCMLLYLAVNHPTIKIIDHVFFESGHSHMECDSIHSKIEQKSKNTPVYTPDGWVQIMRMARKNPRPFNVTTLLYDDFLAFNGALLQFVVAEANKPKKKPLTPTNNTKFQDAVWMQYRKEHPKSIFIKTEYNIENFIEFKLKAKRGKITTITPKNAYNDRLPISKAKKTDLLKLCHDLLIPRCYHQYYENLPILISDSVSDRLPEPDNEEEDEDFVV